MNEYGPSGMMPVSAYCPQCGYSHPPIAVGEKCSLAKEKVGGIELDLNPFFLKLKPMLVYCIQKKEIKDLNKLYTAVILSLQKILDDYKE